MPKCPYCDKETDCLDYHETKTCASVVNLVGGKLEHSDEDTNIDSMGYSCPACNEEICMADADAIKFLEGGE